eukprot:CAMPEP_0185030844 /NCGR_PEP_ID=MMETSP1103-20130426/17936_1 /TAXON_ID=36769 /ORGANISM="Paraphysomonas bandaiensis, Strain Caron Lab Isolate" /LENGTH=316 /DNA_ID=CAMNT_0027566123 /DNA_START=92 /DNA_END=1042 /DNA_ORIENTATION=+
MTSFPVIVAQGFPPFHSLATLGGVLWCTGNMMCGPIIQLIGMGMGLLIWGSFNMLMGWASGTFGLFGLDKEEISNPALNYAGVSLALVGLYVFLQVKSNEVHGYMKSVDLVDTDLTNSLLAEQKAIGSFVLGDSQVPLVAGDTEPADQGHTFGSEWSPVQRRVVGLCAAAITGVFFGCSFNPAQWVIDNRRDGSDNSLNYVFPHFCGILLASWVYTVAYFALKRRHNQEPYVNPASFLPATISGLMWGVAEIAWFVANGKLGFAIAFPIITSGPGFIGSMYGIFLFKEIVGMKNIYTLILAFMITFPGLIMVALSH